MLSSPMDKRGRITVPRKVREGLGLAAGDRIDFVVERHDIVLRVVPNFQRWIGVVDKFPGGEKGIIARLRDMRDE